MGAGFTLTATNLEQPEGDSLAIRIRAARCLPERNEQPGRSGRARLLLDLARQTS